MANDNLDAPFSWWIASHSTRPSVKGYWLALIETNLKQNGNTATLLNERVYKAVEEWLHCECSGNPTIDAYSYLSFDLFEDLILAKLKFPRPSCSTS